MPRSISFGFSPCPNDTFAFHALVNQSLAGDELTVRPVLADVQELNRRALAAELELSKLSFSALAHVADDYWLLRSGAALGRGCGPLVVTRPECRGLDLGRAKVASPGPMTTAHLLLGLYLGQEPRARHMVFSQVMPAVAAGDCDAGVIIHEGRFTYGQYGLVEVVDLGRWWEETTGLPIPLGCIAARRDLGRDLAGRLEDLLARSVARAQAEPTASREFVLAHAQEMSHEVVAQHIALYVNDFSRELGELGLAAVDEMMARGTAAGLLPPARADLLL